MKAPDDFEPDVYVDPVDLSHATPELWAALAMAQENVETVGKDGTNRHSQYNYSTADAMIREGRRCRKGTGLALVCTTTLAHAPPSQATGKQWVSHTVSLHWVLGHKSGGYIRGRAEIDAIASGMRPNDKASQAAATYLHGFIERDLFDLDRAEESEAVDQRKDDGFSPQQSTQRKTTRKSSGGKDRASAKGEVVPDAAPTIAAAKKAWADYIKDCRDLGVESKRLAEFIADATKKPLEDVEKGADRWDALPLRYWEAVLDLVQGERRAVAVPDDEPPLSFGAGEQEVAE